MILGSGIITGVSISHAHATVDAIETVSTDNQRVAVESLLEHPDVSEAFVLQTCNRAEAYVVTDSTDAANNALAMYVDNINPEIPNWLDHDSSIEHLMRVACGLESLVIGEDQILGQFREAYEDALVVGGIGTTFDEAILKALHVGERARNETQINEGIVSLGSAAVKLASEERDLEESTGVVVGAGEISTLAARSFDDLLSELYVVNRTIPHAEHIVQELSTDATAVGLDALPIVAAEAEVIVTATGAPGFIIDGNILTTLDDLIIIDLAQPRDVNPNVSTPESVRILDLDSLHSITEETRAQRKSAAQSVESMISEEFEQLMAQFKRKRADQVIAAMYEGAERVKRQELDTALGKLTTTGSLDEDQEAIIEAMADALVNQILATPTKSLRDAAENDDWSAIHTAIQLFDPGSPHESATFASVFEDTNLIELKKDGQAEVSDTQTND